MAFPARRRGLRSITIGGRVFHWRFPPSEYGYNVVIYGAASSAQRLNITLRNWDVWRALAFPIHNQPAVITPAFVRRAIEFGLQSGWQPEERRAAFKIEWNGEDFRLTP